MLATISGETGHTERDGQAVSKRVLDYIRAAGVEWPNDQMPPYWGGGLLAWAAIKRGLTPPPGAMDADSWSTWGHPKARPEPGCIVVLTGAVHQVGLVMRVAGEKLYIVHPVNGEVGTEGISLDRVITTRSPPAGGAAPLATAGSGQDIRITLEQPAAAQGALPAPPLAIEHQAAAFDEYAHRALAELGKRIVFLEQELSGLNDAFHKHSHTPKRADGTIIAWEDLVLKSDGVHTQ